MAWFTSSSGGGMVLGTVSSAITVIESDSETVWAGGPGSATCTVKS